MPEADAYRALKRRIAARIVTGVVVGEAVEILVVGSGVVEQVRDAEVHPATARKDLMADRAVHRIRITALLRVRLGEGDAHLHRAAGANRIPVGEQALAQAAPCR